MMPEGACCATCIFWRSDKPAITTAERRPQGSSALIGACMFPPPAIVSIGDTAVSMQPDTRADRFCGEWEPDFDAFPTGPGRPGGGEVIDLANRKAAA